MPDAGAAESPPTDASERPSLLTRFLRTPLLSKLVTLDLGINLVALYVAWWTPQSLQWEVSAASLVVVLVLNAGLVAWALRPLAILESTARRVTAGAYGERARVPWMTDANLVRIADVLNSLLDTVAAERARVRSLAAQVVAAGDLERAKIARELHDGTAQSLSAIEMLLASTLAECPEGATHDRLRLTREIATEALAEVRALSHAVHPRVLDDLGLPAALEQLVRRTREQSGLPIALSLPGDTPVSSRTVAAVLYRVAQEALHNVVKHASASQVEVQLEVVGSEARLTVTDDGVGFDAAARPTGSRGLGLFVMRERVALVDGTLALESTPGQGTKLRVAVPRGEAP